MPFKNLVSNKKFSTPAMIGLPLVTAVALFAGLGRSEAKQQPAPPPAPEVTVAEVIHKPLHEWQEFSGRLQAVNTVEVRPRVSGYIDRVAFEDGARVKKGQLLFQIDPRPFQAEVDRLTAEPDTDDYGRLTVTVAARAQADYLFTVGPGAFRPAPKVDSAVVRLTPRPAPFAIDDLDAYDRLVTAAFSQRRKTLGNALKQLLPAAQIEATGIDPRRRGETLTPAQFALLANRWVRTRV